MASSAASLRVGLLSWLDRLNPVNAMGWAILLMATLLVQFSGLTDRPVGYYLDESSISYNAWTILRDGVDEHGRPWPLSFEAFGEWKPWPFIYLLAGVYALTGPSIEAARFISALAGVGTVLLMALLALRITRRHEAAFLTGFTVLLLPWTFEPTRVVMEPALMPVLIAGYLLALQRYPPTALRFGPLLLLAVLLGLITHTYTVGRILAPLLALGLALYATRERWRPVAVAWLLYGVMLLPLAVLALTQPQAATARFDVLSYLGRPPLDVAVTFVHQLLGNLDPVRWLLEGDPNQRHHAAGIMGSMLFASLALGIIGIDRAVHRAERHPWSRYLLFGLAASFLPATLTLDLFHAHRLIAVPVFLVALAIGAQAWLLVPGRRENLRYAAFIALAIATLAQGLFFQLRYDVVAPQRGPWFDSAYPVLLRQALATGADRIYLKDEQVPGYIHGLWYAAEWGLPEDRLVRLSRDEQAPSGALVLSSQRECPQPCEQLGAGGFFLLYRVLPEGGS